MGPHQIIKWENRITGKEMNTQHLFFWLNIHVLGKEIKFYDLNI